MIVARRAQAIAVVVALAEQRYTVCTYADEQAWRSSSPSDTLHLAGTPNAIDILAALPAGWTAEPGLTVQQWVPDSVTQWQIRRWLMLHDVSESMVDDMIDSIEDAATREAVRLDWQWAERVQRSHPMIPVFAAALGVTDVSLAFIEASRLGVPTIGN